MLKVKKKEMESTFTVIQMPWCACQKLLNRLYRFAYRTDRYGVSSEYYLAGEALAICHGYRPHGQKVPRDFWDIISTAIDDGVPIEDIKVMLWAAVEVH